MLETGLQLKTVLLFFDHQFAYAFVEKIPNWCTEDDEIISFLAKFFQKEAEYFLFLYILR